MQKLLFYHICVNILYMSEPVLTIRNRLIDDLAHNGIGLGLEISLGEAADYGLMNGAMLVRAVGLHLGFIEDTTQTPILAAPEQREHLIAASFSAANHIASFTDRHANESMAEIFGEEFTDCFYLAKRVHNIGASPYGEEAYPRTVEPEDQTLADSLDARMAETGAQYLGTANGQLLITTEAIGVEHQGCPLRYQRVGQPTELENTITSLVDEYLNPASVFYCKGYHGMANFVLLVAQRGQPRDPGWSGHRGDWQLPVVTGALRPQSD